MKKHIALESIVVTLLLAVAGCGTSMAPPATAPTPAMRTNCQQHGMTEVQMQGALRNWTNDRYDGYSKQDVLLYHLGQCNYAGNSDPQLEATCQACVQAIADATFGPG